MIRPSVDRYMARVRSGTYTCFDLTREVWLDLTGHDLNLIFENGITATAMRHFSRIQKPVSPCLALLYRPRFDPHIGVYIDGRILHLGARGVQFSMPDVVKMGFPEIIYYV